MSNNSGEPSEFDPLVNFVEAAKQGLAPRARDHDAFRDAVDSVLLGAPRRHTWPEFLDRVSGDEESTQRLWRAVGFPRLDDADRAFTDNDIAAEQMLHSLIDAGVLTPERVEAVARSMAQSMSRLAEWQVDMLHDVVINRLKHLPTPDALAMVVGAIPVLEQAQTLVWRRHLDAAVMRRLATAGPPTQTRRVTVGFADMVGFTRLTRSLEPDRLNYLLDLFEQCTTTAIVEHAGQVVKTVGDEVLFTANEPGVALSIALELQAAVAKAVGLPELRIGLATGEVLCRFGDVFGDPVNRASRLTSNALPSQILVDAHTANANHASPVSLVALGEVELAGLGQISIWRVDQDTMTG